MNNTKTLETGRLILRKFTIEDAEGMFNNWATDSNTTKYLNWNPHENIDETKDFITKKLSKYDSGLYNWVVELKDTHEIIGSIGEVEKNLKDNTIALGYCYGSKYWNHGYGTEALRKVIEYLLIDGNFYLVLANHISSNPASGRIMQKAGMKYEATLRERKENSDGTRSDVLCYSIKKAEL